MAASTLARPGTQRGPCKKGACAHRDCAALHEIAETACGICGEPIGFDRAFYDDRSNHGYGLVHAVCLEVRIEEEQRAC